MSTFFKKHFNQLSLAVHMAESLILNCYKPSKHSRSLDRQFHLRPKKNRKLKLNKLLLLGIRQPTLSDKDVMAQMAKKKTQD